MSYQSRKSNGPGFCLLNAVYHLTGKVCDIPEWILGDDLPAVCRNLGLKWYGEGRNITVPDKPCIVIYKTGDGKGHAEYTTNLRQYIGKVDVCGIIMK